MKQYVSNTLSGRAVLYKNIFGIFGPFKQVEDQLLLIVGLMSGFAFA